MVPRLKSPGAAEEAKALKSAPSESEKDPKAQELNEKQNKARKTQKAHLMRGHQAELFLQTWDRGGVDLKGNLTVAQIPKL